MTPSHLPDPDQQAFERSFRAADPVTIRLYGFKDITLPAYLLLLLTTVLVVFGLIALSLEALAPRTEFGERIHRLAGSSPVGLEVALWAPPILLLGLAFEVLECVVVLRAFRAKFQEQAEQVRLRVRSLDPENEKGLPQK